MSEALDRLRKAMLTEQVRVALRNGLTIAEVQAKYPTATKRFVEEQRAFLRQTEGVPDPRRVSVADEVVALSDQGLKVRGRDRPKPPPPSTQAGFWTWT